MGTWREQAGAVIRKTLAGLPADADEKAKRAALRAAYPFGPREFHPYKIWCSEVRRALGLEVRKERRRTPRERMQEQWMAKTKEAPDA